jgi:hypothetical protein
LLGAFQINNLTNVTRKDYIVTNDSCQSIG